MNRDLAIEIRDLRIVLILLGIMIIISVVVGCFLIDASPVPLAVSEPYEPPVEVPVVEDDTLVYDALRNSPYNIDMSIVENAEKYKLQILYTEIKYNGTQVEFIPHSYGMDDNYYFYPASAIKLAAVLAAIHKANTLGATIDNSYKDGLGASKPLSTYIKYVLAVSDNLSFDILFDFLGQSEFNSIMWERDYLSVRAVSHIGGGRANNFSPDFSLTLNNSSVYSEPRRNNTIINANAGMSGLLVGDAHIRGGKRIDQPFDYTNSNRVSLADMQNMLKQIFFMRTIPTDKRFNLSKDDIKLLRREMLSPDNGSYKWFFCGGEQNTPDLINIYSKSGIAQGFVTDNAYVQDVDGNEFLLSATMYCNSDGVVNDDAYDYKNVAMPFMKNLGMTFLDVTRERSKT